MENLDSIFKKGLEGKEQTPPSATWSKLETLLEAQEAPRKQKRRPIFWIAAALVPLFLAWFWFLQNPTIQKDGENMVHTSKEPHATQKAEPKQFNQENATIQKNGNVASVDLLAGASSIQAKSTASFVRKNFRGAKELANSENKTGHVAHLTEQKDPNSVQDLKKATPALSTGEAIVEAKQVKELAEDQTETVEIAYYPQKVEPTDAQADWAEVEFKPGRRSSSFIQSLAALRQDGLKHVGTIADAKETLASLIGYQNK